MKRFDAHIHMESGRFSQDAFLQRLEEAGLYGGVAISQAPQEAVYPVGAAPFRQRLDNVLKLAEGAPQRIFPALWLHPLEDSCCEKAVEAAACGIAAFKIICDAFYPGDEPCVKLVTQMAELGLPVIFHSGILWDGGVSSKYNRPLFFEELIRVPRLRFSLAHCAWPWLDECIALYGKFSNAPVLFPECTAEMFFDLTPGTPRIYRRELMQKLFGVGYDVQGNILFGTDCNVEDYNVEWARTWRETDDALYDELGLAPTVKNHIYEKNLLRFLGRSDETYTHSPPLTGVTL